MFFLCSSHRNNLLDQPEEKITGLWFEWMSQAAVYYELCQWKEAAAYSGCALELSMILLSRGNDATSPDVSTKLCLAAIYCVNCLHHNSDTLKAEYIVTQAVKFLEFYRQKCGNEFDLDTGVRALTDRQFQCVFFIRYLNFPIEEAVQLKKAFLH